MRVVCISGKAGSGKDEVAHAMKETFEGYGENVLIVHFADLLKFICEKFFDWDGKKDEAGRTLLQYVGTNKIRSKSPDFWVDFIANMLEMFDGEWDYVLIPDCRFPNEFEVLAFYGFDVTLVRVNRPAYMSCLTDFQQEHPSETALDDYPWDWVIKNDGTIEDLRAEAISLAFDMLRGVWH